MAGKARLSYWRCLMVLLCGCVHTHPAEEVDENAASVTVWTESTEAFVEHPPMVAAAAPVAWLVHLTRRRDHSPISSGTVVLQIGAVATAPVEATAQGIFSPEVAMPSAGTFAAVLVLEGDSHQERIDLGSVVVYEAESDFPAPALEQPGIEMTKEVQWTVPFLVQAAGEGSVRESVSAPGVIEAASARTAEVVAPVSGLLVASANLRSPSEGSRVARNDVLATIAPLSSETSYATVKAREEQARQELDRLTRLFDLGAVPENRLLNAQRDHDVARSALESLGEPVAADNNYVVQAPISGFVEERATIAGEAVVVGDLLFRIVDPSIVWIRLLMHVRDAGAAPRIEAVSFSVEGSSRVYESRDLVAVGSEVSAENRTLPVIFSVPNEDHSLSIGQFAKGEITVGAATSGVVLEREAIQQEDGVPVVYIQVEGELFIRRPVVLGPGTETHVLIASGVEHGDYVVTRGAYSTYLASLTIGGGAAHHH